MWSNKMPETDISVYDWVTREGISRTFAHGRFSDDVKQEFEVLASQFLFEMVDVAAEKLPQAFANYFRFHFPDQDLLAKLNHNYKTNESVVEIYWKKDLVLTMEITPGIKR